MYATNFEFADKQLSDFGCIICEIGANSGVSEIEIGCDISFNTVKNNNSSIHYKTSSTYENVCQTSFDIAKNPCLYNGNNKYMNDEEIRYLIKWLNRHEYKKFTPFNPEGNSDIHYYGSFNVKRKEINGHVAGLVLTFTSDSPFGYGERIQNNFDMNANETFYIYGDSDEYTTIYPDVTIVSQEDCDLEIHNKTSGTKVVIDNLKAGEEIKLNGEHKYIVSNMEHNNLYDDFKYEWFDIFVSDDECENEYVVNAPVYISVEYEPIRKAGII